VSRSDGGSAPRPPAAASYEGGPLSRSGGGIRVTVLAIVSDAATRSLLPKVVRDRLVMTDDLAEALSLAEQSPPDVAFVEIGMGDGAGLALVHHLKAVVPQVTVYALSSRLAIEAAANAVALGGAGLIMLPAAGDEILSALSAVKIKLADRAQRAELERAALAYARAAGWMARAAALAASPSRAAAAEQLVEVLLEATGAAGAAVYLTAGERPNELTRAAASPELERSPPLAVESDMLDYARRERLLVVPLAVGPIKAGHLLLAPQPDSPVSTRGLLPSASARLDGVVKLLATQAASAFALLGERERQSGAAIKDPASSAYSFAYYADVAGREIDKARRYGRRFSIATVAFDVSGEEGSGPPPLSHAEMADQLLKAARDIDVVAHVDEHEFHLLMPETDGLGAHAARRRVLARLFERGGKALPRRLLVGVSTFPHDGPDLSHLLRVARLRAEATRHSLVRRLAPDQTGLPDLIDALGWELTLPPAAATSAARSIELPLADATKLAAMVVGDAVRGGATMLVVAHHEQLSLGAAVRAALGPPRDNVILHSIDARRADRGAAPDDNIEALAVLAEHGAYAFIGRSEGGMVRGLHAADPLLADLLAERLGKAAGLRLFT
jgi:ActR/RegA family two-component response regulator